MSSAGCKVPAETLVYILIVPVAAVIVPFFIGWRIFEVYTGTMRGAVSVACTQLWNFRVVRAQHM